MSGLKGRNYSLDCIKTIAAILVVFLHAEFPDMTGKIISAYGQFAVPFFFMVSGFFLFSNNRQNIISKTPKKILRLLGLVVLLYFINVVRIFISYNFNINAILQWLMQEVFTLTNIIKFLVLNISAFSGVMWFLQALIYCYLIFFIAAKAKLNNLLAIVSPAFLIVHIINMFCNSLIPNVRFLFIGLPYLSLGYLIRMITQREGVSLKNKTPLFWVALVIGIIITPVEALYNDYFFCVGSNLLIVISVFVLAVIYPQGLNNKMMYFIGNKLSLYVYILHPIIIHVFKLFQNTAVGKVFLCEWAYPLWVLVFSILCSLLVVVCVDKIKSCWSKENDTKI